MTTVQTRVRSISDLEGFDLTVKKDGEEVDVRENGVLSKYPFDKALKGTKTVADWKKDRFERTYPGFTCDVLDGEGKAVTGQTSLRAVRESYEEP